MQPLNLISVIVLTIILLMCIPKLSHSAQSACLSKDSDGIHLTDKEYRCVRDEVLHFIETEIDTKRMFTRIPGYILPGPNDHLIRSNDQDFRGM
jgi:hypothetical protein